jgi:nucleotide-binding universal stress UspA family protein/CBS domain-containing protein
MTVFKRVLCPVDLSKKSSSAIDLATQIARCSGGRVIFIYVAPQWVTDKSLVETDYIQGAIEADRNALHEVLPTDPTVLSEHLFVFGNPGPEIVRVSSEVDVIVMNTHGYTGLKRFLMGSVAEYVTRYAQCPIITLKWPSRKEPLESGAIADFKRRFVTEVMHHVAPIHAEDHLESVVAELRAAKATAAPVVNQQGKCIGILTASDIARFESGSGSGVTVERYHSAPVITIKDSQTCRQAHELLQNNPRIHHLVVVNQQQQPLGVLATQDLVNCAE